MDDALLREPDFRFADYMKWCYIADLKTGYAEIDFLRWLYSPLNSAYSLCNTKASE
jgi:hypothetical protein